MSDSGKSKFLSVIAVRAEVLTLVRNTCWLLGAVALLAFYPNNASAWRSELYPESWTPAHKDAQGRFLHDFSYAGYHKGKVSIPTRPPGRTYNVTRAPYNADNTGSRDATAAIQAAIDKAGSAGGGIVYLPAGTYNVAPGKSSSALKISDNGVVLRGAGANQTYICNTDTYMRKKNVILIQPSSGDWHRAVRGTMIAASADIDYPTRMIPLKSVRGLRVGNTIIVRADCTDDFIADHKMTGKWNTRLVGPTFLRRITSINSASKTIRIDIPTRYYLKTRDNARIYKVAAHLKEVGIEDLSIGMVQNTTAGWGENSYNTKGTGAYEVHGSHVIQFKHARNCWVQRFQTYRPSGNSGDYHALSNILELSKSAHITVRNCVVQKPQYEGGGGNGYGYTLRGGDCLITECVAHHTRHNYDLKSMWTSGNVIHKSTGSSPKFSSDFHMHMSIANLFDSMTVTGGDWLQAVYRPWGSIVHGHSSTEAVFWNTYGEGSGNCVESRQWGWGYIVGTSGGRSGVSRGTGNNTAPEDFLEGQGTGKTLEPQSLYEDQLALRLGAKAAKRPSARRAKSNKPAMPMPKRTVKAKYAKAFNAKLLAKIDSLAGEGEFPTIKIRLSISRKPLLIRGADPKALTVKLLHRGAVEKDLGFRSLTDTDRAVIAVAVAKHDPKDQDLAAAAAFMLECAGRPNMAKAYFERAGESNAKKINDLFEPLPAKE